MTRVLVVQDTTSTAEPLTVLLRSEGFTIAVASDGPHTMAELARHGADVVLLDLASRDRTNGTDVCRQLRARCTVGVIIISARDSEIDKVVGLEVGADDYITRPYSAGELVARVRALVRRRRLAGHRDPSPLVAGPVQIDVGRHLLTVRGTAVALPLKEFDLLEYLMRNAGQVLTRRQLLERVWGADHAGAPRTLDVHVMRLRSKIEPDRFRPSHLLTVRGLGYRFVP